MMRTPKEALAWIGRQVKSGPSFAAGWCKRKCREAYLIDSTGPETDATQEWAATRYRVKGAWIPGAFLWWTGGSEGHGHVAICGWRVGHIKTVDYPRTGHWNTTTVAALEKAWPKIRWAGMSPDIDGRVPRRHLPRIVRRWDHA
jgi:hypothetical protein